MFNTMKDDGTGLVDLSDSTTATDVFILGRILQMAYANSAVELARYAYVAGFFALRLSYGIQILDDPPSNDGWQSLSNMYNTQLAGPLQFCNGYPQSMNSDSSLDSIGDKHRAPDCAIFAMNTFDSGEPAVGNGHLNVLNPHCTDEFSIPDTSWARNATWRYPLTEVPEKDNDLAGHGALNVPPMDLVQQYYICYNKLETSLALAFGSSAGTAGIATTVVITLCLSIISAGWFKPKRAEGEGEGEGVGKKKEASAISQGAVMMAGILGTGAAIEMSSKK